MNAADWLVLSLAFSAVLLGCSGPVVEKPPCDEATLAQIVATCPDAESCNQKLDERQALCAKRVKEEP